MIEKTQVIEWIEIYARSIAENRTYLTGLDAAIGDADHGVNLDRGFCEVVAKLPALTEQDIGALLKGTGMTLLSKVGGASGPLYGTLFMRMASLAAGKETLTDRELLEGIAAGVSGIQQRGSAQPGEKTMVDTLLPAIVAWDAALEGGNQGCAAVRLAAEAAEEGMRATIPMQATKGRASYLGPRSIGHQDPGATSAYLLIEALAKAMCQ